MGLWSGDSSLMLNEKLGDQILPLCPVPEACGGGEDWRMAQTELSNGLTALIALMSLSFHLVWIFFNMLYFWVKQNIEHEEW